ncbi:MAG: hypothetical protein RMJ28_06705 [Nitrososphaerota archaeon]|nr:hypothetical protein [Candidatus Calditenuaceae archaeon]MDW8073904.1 hypothetical protein [Nitrososphaerota archaeon]
MIELNQELEMLKRMGSYVDELLTELSFRKADVLAKKAEQHPAQPPPQQALVAQPTIRSVRSRTGANLATISYTREEARFQISPGVELRSDDKPFTSFLLRKVLDQMVEEDRRRAEAGEIDPDKVLSYEIVYDGDKVKEILVRNYRQDSRLRELISSVRWTLETVSSR